MPTENRWYEFTREKIIILQDNLSGIYYIADKGKIPVYIGKSDTDIRGRLLVHLNNKCCKTQGKYFKVTLAKMFENPEDMEAQAGIIHARKYKKPPICSDKRPLLYHYP